MNLSRTTNPKVSIIIPVYNVDAYLQPCLTSATGQSLKEIEIICINDGSTDNSLKVLEVFAKNDARIIVLDQLNGGVSSARNAGLSIARGDYIRFLDGDDILPLEACENLYQYAVSNNSDVVISSSYSIEKNGQQKAINLFSDATFDLRDIDQRRIVFSKYSSFGTHNQFFRTKTIQNVKFKPLTNGEDLLFFIETICKANVVSTMSKSCYFYVRRDNSASSQNNEMTFKIFLHARKESIHFLEKEAGIDQIEDVINRKILGFAVGDFISLLGSQKKSKLKFDQMYEIWYACYSPTILKPRNKKYRGENLARLIFKANSPRLFILIFTLVRIYLWFKLNFLKTFKSNRSPYPLTHAS